MILNETLFEIDDDPDEGFCQTLLRVSRGAIDHLVMDTGLPEKDVSQVLMAATLGFLVKAADGDWAIVNAAVIDIAQLAEHLQDVLEDGFF